MLLLALATLIALWWWAGRHTGNPERPSEGQGEREASAAPAIFVPAPAIASATPSRAPVAAKTGEPPPMRPKEWAQLLACQNDRRQRLLERRGRIDVGAGPAAAADHALLTSMAGMLDPKRNGMREAERELAAARRRWPDDVDLVWMHLAHCTRDVGCDRGVALDQLVRADSENGAVWMLVAADAAQREQDAIVDMALGRASRARIHDSRTGALFLRLRPLLDGMTVPLQCTGHAGLSEDLGHPPGNDDLLDIEAMAAELGMGLSSLSSLRPCDPAGGSLPARRRADCISVLRRMASGDTLLEQIMANRMLLRLADDAGQADGAATRLAQLEWLQHAGARASKPGHYMKRIWSEGEVNLLQRLVLAQGLWPPPAEWMAAKTADYRARAKVAGSPP